MNQQNSKSNYQLMTSELTVDPKFNNRTLNIEKIKKINPQSLPPAGKNFYEQPNSSLFITAQKYGSYLINSQNGNKYSLGREETRTKVAEPIRKTGKRLYPSQFNHSYSKYHPMIIEGSYLE